MRRVAIGPGSTEASADELRARVEPLLAGEGWVVDGAYRRKLGDLVFRSADAVVWLDLPMRVWLLRQHFRRRRVYPGVLAPYDVVRLRTPREVERWLATFG